MPVSRYRVRPDVAGQNHLEAGSVQAEAQAACTAEQIHRKRGVSRDRSHVAGQLIQAAAGLVRLENLFRASEGLEPMRIIRDEASHHQAVFSSSLLWSRSAISPSSSRSRQIDPPRPFRRRTPARTFRSGRSASSPVSTRFTAGSRPYSRSLMPRCSSWLVNSRLTRS